MFLKNPHSIAFQCSAPCAAHRGPGRLEALSTAQAGLVTADRIRA